LQKMLTFFPLATILTVVVVAASASADPIEVIEISPAAAIGLQSDPEDGSIVNRDEAEEEDWNEVDLGAEDVVARHLDKRSPKFVGEKKLKKLVKKKALFKLPKAIIGGIGLSGGGLGGLGIGALGPQLLGALPLRSINGLPLIGKRKKRSPKVQQVGQKLIKKMLKKKVLFKLPKKMIGGIGLSGGGLGGLGLGAFGPQLVRALPLPINGLPLIGKRKKRSPSPKFVGEKKLKKLLKKKALFKLPKAAIGGIGLSGGGLGGFGLGAFGTQLIGALPLRSINGLPLIGKRKKRSPNPKIVGYDGKFKKKLLKKKALFKLPKAMIGGIGLSGGGLGGLGLGALGPQLIRALPLPINGLPLIG